VKRLAALAGFLVVGFATAIAVVQIVGAFDHNPGCGLDCASLDSSFALLSGFVTVLLFPIAGYILTRGDRLTARRTLVILAALVTTAVLAASCRYVFELHSRYVEAEAASSIKPNLDFMYMAIATRDVQTYTKSENGHFKPASIVPQWQRCAIDAAWCDKKPRQAHMLCKTGVVYVNEADWNAFSLIPQERLDVAPAMKSMNLCAANNIVEP
jgi:hypothetical protein